MKEPSRPKTVYVSSNFGISKTFEAEREVDALAEAATYLNEEYAKRKGPDDPARVIREE